MTIDLSSMETQRFKDDFKMATEPTTRIKTVQFTQSETKALHELMFESLRDSVTEGKRDNELAMKARILVKLQQALYGETAAVAG